VDSELAKSVNRDYFAFKEVERPKCLPGRIVQMMRDEGFSKFNMHWHTELWKELNTKDPAKGFGVEVGYWVLVLGLGRRSS
jgi:hypothetical protein